MMGVAVYFILVVLALSGHSLGFDADGRAGFYSKAADQDVWPDFTVLAGGHGGFLSQGLLQPPSLHELERNFPVPLHTLDFMNAGPSFAIKVMNSSWSGLAGADVYQRGELVYLQVTSDVPDPELYIHSCYVAPSPNPTDKSRYALILNKGCVSSKQSMLKFVSRQSDSINLVLNTSSLKFPKMYVHCSVVLSSHGLTQNTKSCNYIESKSRWVDLSGQSDVCDCCATKCRSPPYYEGLFSELRTVVSVGPLTIKEQEHEKQLSVFNGTSITASQIGASAVSTRKGWIMSGASPSVGKGWIASGASVSGSSVLKRPPLMTQPVTADLIISQELGGGLSFSLPGLVLDVQSFPVLEMGVVYPQQKGSAKVTMLSGPADSLWAKPEVTMQEDPSKMLPQLESRHQEFANAGDVLVADAPNLTSDEASDMPEPVLEDFRKSGEEELRGDVFTNFREPQLENIPQMKNSGLQKDMIPAGFLNKDDILVLTQTEKLFKMVKGDTEAKPDSVKQSKLTLSQVSDGSSLLSFEEEERSPVVGEEAVRKTTLELKRSKMEDKLGEERSKQLHTETKLVSSLLDLLRGMKMQ